jgi:hypothetical protein
MSVQEPRNCQRGICMTVTLPEDTTVPYEPVHTPGLLGYAVMFAEPVVPRGAAWYQKIIILRDRAVRVLSGQPAPQKNHCICP